MSHVGNDIVDLKAPAAKGKSKDLRFLKRVLTKNETEIMLNSESPDTLLWLFWAAKETAYKAISKNSPAITSAPLKYEVVLNMSEPYLCRGKVSTPSGTVNTRFVFDDDKVSCIGKTGTDDFSQVISGFGSINTEINVDYDTSSEQVSSLVREHAINSMSDYFNEPVSSFKIDRFSDDSGNPGPPVVLLNGKHHGVDISLSHDGRFYAYAWVLLTDL